MGARPSSFKQSGGFLNNVDGTFVDYVFTDEFNRTPFVAGKDPKNPSKDKFHSLYCRIAVLPDGAEDVVETTLWVGGFDDFIIEEDGKIISRPTFDRASQSGDNDLAGGTAFTKLVSSAVDAGFPVSELDELENDFRAMLGKRYRWVQKSNVELTKEKGKRKDPKTGKEYDRKDLVIDQYYGPSSATAKVPAKAGKGSAAIAKGATSAADLTAATTETLLAILAKNPKGIKKARLSTAVISINPPNREAVRKLIMSQDFLDSQTDWLLDGDTISPVPAE